MLLGLVGFARAGKDSVANILVRDHGYTKMGFADGVRDMAKAIDPFVEVRHPNRADTHFARYSAVLQESGYEAAKANPDVRRLLQRIGTEAVRSVLGPDVWVNRTLDLSDGMRDVVISDVRFPNEANAIRAAGGIVVRIERPGYGGTDPHPSEAQVADIETHATITATDMSELEGGVALFMSQLPGMAETLRTIYELDQQQERIYLAAPWVYRVEAREAKQALVNAGLSVVSGWTEREEGNGTYDQDAAFLQHHAKLDADEVQAADTLVILNLTKSEGKASEMGMALAQGKRVVLVGPRTGNIFYHLPEVEQVDTLDAAIALLGGIPQEPTVQELTGWVEGE